MKFCFKTVAAAIFAALMSVASAQAATITYSTYGVFSQTTTNVYNSGGVQITYNGVTNVSVDLVAPDYSNINLGIFDVDTLNAVNTPINGTFTLYLTQSSPTVAGPISWTGTLGGTIRNNQSNANILFGAPFALVLDLSTYTLREGDGGALGNSDLNPPTTLNGQSTVEGRVQIQREVNVPEPATLTLLAFGLMGGSLAIRRRRAA